VRIEGGDANVPGRDRADRPTGPAVAPMLNAFGLGALAQSSLLLAGLLVCWVAVPRRLVGVLAGLGAGAMLSAISFDLVPETEGLDHWELALWMFAGVALFLIGDRVVERRFGSEGTGGAMGIVVGSVVDGVPESIIFGIQLATGMPVSASFLAAVLVSNVPQAIAPSSELAAAGWGPRRLGRLWALVVLACGVSASLGYLAADLSGDITGARMAAIAAGGLLAMLTNSLMPFAYSRGGEWAGVATVLGFCVSLGGS
jgi:ZIP family zinc transporter